MPFERLTKVLHSLGEGDLEIQKAYAIQLGCVAFSTDEPTEAEDYPVTARETRRSSTSARATARRLLDSYADIPTAIKAHPNVFAVTQIDKPARDVSMRPSPIGQLLLGPTFHVSLNLPAHQQYLYRPGSSKPIEKFEVVSTGSLFAAYAPVRDYDLSIRMGNEYREIARSQVEKETKLSCPVVGPSPIHPHFYLVLAKNFQGHRVHTLKRYTRTNDVLLIAESGQNDIKKEVDDILYDVQIELARFYSVMLSIRDVIEYHQEMSSHFSDLTESIDRLHSIPWWDVFGGAKIAGVGRSSLSLVHKHFVALEERVFLHGRQRSEVLAAIREHNTLSLMLDYFTDSTESLVHIQHSLPVALTHFGEELRIFVNIRWIVIASLVGLIGAIIGAIAGSILTVLFT